METEIFDLLGRILGGMMIGAFCGIVPLLFAIKKKKILFGIFTIILCSVCGLVLTTIFYAPAFLAFIPAGVCVAVILLFTKGHNNEK